MQKIGECKSVKRLEEIKEKGKSGEKLTHSQEVKEYMFSPPPQSIGRKMPDMGNVWMVGELTSSKRQKSGWA